MDVGFKTYEWIYHLVNVQKLSVVSLCCHYNMAWFLSKTVQTISFTRAENTFICAFCNW